jgi:hypothetical protein
MDLKTAMEQAIKEGLIKPTRITTKATTNRKVDKASTIQHRHTGKKALKPYRGIVELPHHRGGGVMWLKSAHALSNYEDLNYKVVWL